MPARTTTRARSSIGGGGDAAAIAAVAIAARTLGLPTVRDDLDEHLATAEREHLSYAGFLADLLSAECDDRATRRQLRRVREAGFPRPKRLEQFNFDANPAINPATINTLAAGDWITTGSPLCLIGDPGTGKTHLLIGLGTAAAEQGHRVRYVLASKLVNELAEAATEHQLAKTIARYGRLDLLCIDELGYLSLDRHGAELLFQVLTEREEKASIAIAANEPFSSWTTTFTDPRLCAAIIDRLTFNGHIIQTGTTSYRLATPARTRTDQPTWGQFKPSHWGQPRLTYSDTAVGTPHTDSETETEAERERSPDRCPHRTRSPR